MPEHLVHICEILNVTSDYLYFGETKKICEEMNSLSNIDAMLVGCNLDKIRRVEQMVALFLGR